MKLNRILGAIGGAALLASACGGSDDPVEGGDDVVTTAAPLCGDLVANGGKEIFAHAVVPTDSVSQSLVFGGMDPGGHAPINYELGFLLNATEVPVVAPADLYVRSVDTTRYISGGRAGNTDYGFAFDICAEERDGKRVPTVEGDFAHITALSEEFAAMLDSYEFDCVFDENSEEQMEKCGAYLPPSIEEGLVIPAGTIIGSAGGKDGSDYTPGFDFNIADGRYANLYVNPDRLGAEEGPARMFRYGACVYEYFVDPYRTAYLDKIGQNGVLRDHLNSPCGTLSFGDATSAAGVWIRADKAELTFNQSWNDVTANLLVLAPHPIESVDRQVISTELASLSFYDGEARLIEFDHLADGDVNTSFYEMVPDVVYCLDATSYGNGIPFSYYVELGTGAATLKVEALDGSCAGTPENERVLSSAAIDFVR